MQTGMELLTFDYISLYPNEGERAMNGTKDRGVESAGETTRMLSMAVHEVIS